jgi:hypothetical protein
MKQRQRLRQQTALALLLLAPFTATALLRSSTNNNNNSGDLESSSSSSPRALRPLIKWWYQKDVTLPGGGSCVQNIEYPSDYPVNFPKLLYDTKDGCCANHQDVSCLLVVPTSDTTQQEQTMKPIPPLTNEPTAAPIKKVEKWYPLNGNCVRNTNYPEWMGAGINVYTYLFDSNDDCCAVHGCNTKQDKWWPVNNDGVFVCQLGNDYPEEFLEVDGLLFDTEEKCCEVYCGEFKTTSSTEAAETTTSTTTTTTTTTTTEEMVQNSGTIAPPFSSSTTTSASSSSSCDSQQWHISTLPNTPNTCTNDKSYPSAWDSISGYLFASPQECCDTFFSDSPHCITKNVCQSTDTAPSIVGDTTTDCGKKWHISILPNGLHTCTNDNVYPPEWDTLSSTYLLSTPQECCSNFFPGVECKILNHCDCHSNWHISIQTGELNTCTNDERYPASWHNAPQNHLYMSHEECCERNFEGEECNVRDACKDCVDTWHVNPDAPGGSW